MDQLIPVLAGVRQRIERFRDSKSLNERGNATYTKHKMSPSSSEQKGLIA